MCERIDGDDRWRPLILASPLPALAHSDFFAKAQLEVVADNKENVAELRNVWRFDDVFSSSVVIDFDKNTDLKLEPNELLLMSDTFRKCRHAVVRPDADQVISQNRQSLTDAFFNDPTGTDSRSYSPRSWK